MAGACGGGSSRRGTYFPDETTLELREDGTFAGRDATDVYEGTYAVEGDTISFTQEGVTVDADIRDDGSIFFAGEEVACVKR